jgi:hypothetical protein
MPGEGKEGGLLGQPLGQRLEQESRCPPELPSGMFSGSRHGLSVKNLPGSSRGWGERVLA